MEEFLTLTKEHSLVTKGRALGATGYVAVCALFAFWSIISSSVIFT